MLRFLCNVCISILLRFNLFLRCFENVELAADEESYFQMYK